MGEDENKNENPGEKSPDREEKAGRNWLRFFLGSYTPPEFIRAFYRFVKTGGLSASFRRGRASFKNFVKTHKVQTVAAVAVICLLVGGIWGYRFYQSRKPQPIVVEYSVTPPVENVKPEDRRPLVVQFRGSAAPVEAAGREVAGGITISPAIAGTWKWEGDSVLRFETENPWAIGQKYTVTFARDFFPSHIKAEPSFSFSMEDFRLDLGFGEFYIDPENSAVKRVLATVTANYPIDTAMLEGSIVIEPKINADSGQLRKKRYDFTVAYNETFTAAYIVSEPLGMPSRTVDMNIAVLRGVRSASGQGTPAAARETSVSIPGMTSYVQVQSLGHELVKNDSQIYDQVFILNTRGTIDQEELNKNLTVYELPVDRPELPGLKAAEKYAWRNADEVLPEVLALSRKIEPQAIPNELRYNSVNSYRFSAEPGRYIFVQLNNGARFYGDYFLSDPYRGIFRVKDFPKEVAILSDGSILSFSGDKRLSLLSRGVEDVHLTIGRIRPDDLNHLVSQTNGDITDVRFRSSAFSEYNVTQRYTQDIRVPLASPRDISYFSFDFSRYLETIPSQNLRHGLFIFRVQGTGQNSRFSDRRLIMITDLGFFVKTNADGSRDVFVQSIATGNPVEGAAVSVLGLNGNPVVSGITGHDGRVHFPDLSDYTNEQAPTAFTVRRGEDMSFMPFRTDGRILDYSSFNVGGVRGASDPQKLQAFLFSDRGLYRPGDEVRLALVVKSGDWTRSLVRTPLEWVVTDPKGTEILNQRISLSSQGIEELLFSTQDWSPTGTYTASVYVIREENEKERREFLGSQTVKVEEFLPDTLNVSAVFEPLPEGGWISPGDLEARVSVRNLFGTPGRNNEVKAQITLAPGHQYFRQYRDYRFQDPFLAKNRHQEFLGTKTTGQDGTARFSLNLGKFEKATYNLTFYAEAFEKGSGRNVSAETSVYVSPLPWLIGYKSDGSLGYIQKDSVRMVSFIAIDPRLDRTAVENLRVTLTELRYVSALVRQPNGVYKYQSVQKEFPISSEPLNIPAAGLDYRLPTGSPGEYTLVVTGPDDLEYNKIKFSVSGSENLTRSLNRTAELELTLNKTDFVPGENLEIMIKAPYQGAGLITIERDKVYSHKWFRSAGETTVETIRVPAELEGNAYVNVMYVRDQDSREIFMSPLSYGAAPFSVSLDSRTNPITLDFPGQAKPGQDFTINYSTARRGKIVIYAVDEGILQLARYTTPDPLGFFFRKRALEVRTTQILDLILPKYAVVQSLAAMGGGEGYDELARNLNPFKRRQYAPVAYWSGVMDSGPEVRSVTYEVPDYFNGTLRVMAVAVSDSAVGAAEDRALLQSTFVLSPNAPMMAAPGDEFEISLTVTNLQEDEKNSGRVRLAAAPSDHFTLPGGTVFDLEIPRGQEKTLNIPVKAEGPLGAGEIRFTASNNGESSELSSYLSVRPAVPYRVSLYTGAINNRSAEVKIDRRVYEEFHTRDVSASYLPLGMAKGLHFYLDTFPYGCTEQLVSAVFPFLYPQLFRELGFTRQEAEEGIYRVISILQARLKSDGTLGIWTAQSSSDPFITLYCLHFLTEARNGGYYVAPAFINRLLTTARSIAGGSGTSRYDFLNRAYAVYLLTLNEVVATPLLESLKRDIGRTNREIETELPGLFLAGSYAMLQQASEANTLLGRIKRNYARDDSMRYVDDLLYNALYLNVLARHFPQRLRDLSESLFLSMAERLEQQSYTTLSANFALMAVDAYLKAVPAAETGNYLVQEILAGGRKNRLNLAGRTLFSAEFSPEAEKISLENNDRLNLFYQVTLGGFDLEKPQTEVKNGIEVYREFTNEAGEAITSAKMGDVVLVKLNFRTVDKRTIGDVALVDLLPAGLEPDIDSIRNRRDAAGWRPDYVDIREDRLVVFGTVAPEIGSFVYRTRAINSGTFTVPPLFAEALYDKSVWALRPQGNFVISKNE